MKKVTLLNTTILTADGRYELLTVSLVEAKNLLKGAQIQSAIGHQSTADILTELLDTPIQMNRINFEQTKDDICLCFKLKGRPEEGKILTTEDIEEIGYEFKVLIKNE